MKGMIADQLEFLKNPNPKRARSAYVKKLILENCTCPKAIQRHLDYLAKQPTVREYLEYQEFLKAKAASEGQPGSYIVTEGQASLVAETPTSAEPPKPEQTESEPPSNASDPKR